MSTKRQNLWILLIFIFLGNISVFSQKENEPKEEKLPEYILVHLSFSFQKPNGDMGNRYNWNNTTGLGLDYLSSKNFIFGIQTDYLFGTRIKEDVLANLRNSDGNIIGNNKAPANIKLTLRGWNANVLFGKLFPFKKTNPRSGIRATIGAGILQHKIRIQQDPQSLVPQTNGGYEKGYDRLTNGLAFTEFFGYQKISRNRRINLMLGVELVQGFTQNQREFDFDKRAKDTSKYFDFILGGKFAWTIPFEIRKNPEEIWY